MTTNTNAPAKAGTIVRTAKQDAVVAKEQAALSATAKGRKTAKQETTRELTKAQETALAKLVSAATEAITQSEANGGKAKDLASQLESAVTARDDYKVYAARAMAKLSTHPAVVATGGPTKGQPALTKMAQLMGRPPQSLETYWKAARALITKGWDKRTGAPKQDERTLVGEPFKSESARVSVAQAKAKAGKPGNKPKTTVRAVSFSSIEGQLDAVLKSVQTLLAATKLTPAQEKVLFTKLDEVTDAIENGSK